MASAEACRLYSLKHLLCPRFQSTNASIPPPPASLSSSGYTGDMRRETLPSPPPLALPLSFLFPPFSLSLFTPSWSLSVHYCSSLKCSTSNTTTVQVDVFHCPLQKTHTQAHARSQTEAELLNGAAAREIRARLHYEKKLADFIKDCSVNKRTGCPD